MSTAFGTNTLATVNAVRVDIHDTDFFAQPDQYLLSYVSLTAPRQITLPDCIDVLGNANKMYIVKDETGLADVHNITIIGFGTIGVDRQPIDGDEAGIAINSQKGALTLVSNGVSWYVV